MKPRVIASKSGEVMNFYLLCSEGKAFLFSQKYQPDIYNYFRKGRADGELHEYHQWRKNPRLGKTINKCLNPSYRRVGLEELAA